MKIEAEIPDIERDEVICAMASKVLDSYLKDDHEESTPSYLRTSMLAEQMRAALRERIDALASEVIREFFDTTVKARIESCVDEVLAEGWQVTDHYGSACGPRVDLKGRISDMLLKANGTVDRRTTTMVQQIAHETIQRVVTNEFAKEIDAARVELRKQLDAVVAGKFSETLKKAMGL